MFEPGGGWAATMRTAMLAHRVYSISREGSALLKEDELAATLGGFTLDLVSAPIAPGEYRLRVSAALGGGEIFLPRCVRLTIDDRSVFGGEQVFAGEQHWPRLRRQLQGTLPLPEEIPSFALESFKQRPVSIHITAHAVMGGFAVYQV